MTRAGFPIGGSLLSRSFLQSLDGSAAQPAAASAELARELRRIGRAGAALGPSASARAVADVFAIPLARLFGFDVRPTRYDNGGLVTAMLASHGRAVALLAAAPGAERLEAMRLPAVAAAATAGTRWSVFANGRELALLDASRPHARRWLVADVEACGRHPAALQTLLAALGAPALVPGGDGRAPIELMIAASDASLREVRAALQAGVERAALILTSALARARAPRARGLDALFEESLTVVYRILFLQFAESRGLVPVWHPTYRHGYTIEALCEAIERRGDSRGTWDALQAIARLAHRGARAGDLVVVPFNGRLFSPAHAPAVAGCRVSDADAAAAVSALASVRSEEGHAARIPFADLGVEQLGSIYERVLDFTPERDPRTGAATLRRGGARKTTGSFYTPRTLTEFIVRRALRPVVSEASPDRILSLRILDPAMGSGAFLVAACRYLAAAYESALVLDGAAGATDLSPQDRAGFRRLIAQRCLYGVDVNPMAVQLGRLSLWLCSLAGDKPLTFLDHRLRSGNSLIGASPEDMLRQAPGARRRGAEPTLFGADALEPIGRALDLRQAIASIPDDTLADVQRKERILADLDSERGPLATWRRLCDAWCAVWFQERGGSGEAFGALACAARGDTSFFHPAVAARLAQSAAVARTLRFFHWPLEFPEIFFPKDPAQPAGFDAVVGNPPWDMIRGADASRRTVRFTRDSGIYRLQSTGHSNAYQLFLERSIQLLKPGGRVGLVLPWSLATDEGSAALRRRLLDRCTLDDLAVLDNRDAIFPIHRALKFVALCATVAGRTDAIRYPPAVRDGRVLEGAEFDAGPHVIEITRRLIERVSGPSLAIPYLGSSEEARVLEQISRAAPVASSGNGWGLAFGRELNASDDKALLTRDVTGYPVIAGRHIEPFRAHPEATDCRVAPDTAARRLGDAIMRHRLAYRDVAGAGNRTTLIAAIVPPRVVTTHTLFCLRTRLPFEDQLFVCALLNSYVANFVVRTRVGTHVTTALVHALPLPRPGRGGAAFARIVSLARARARGQARPGEIAKLEAEVARLYGLDRDMFAIVLSTFPLVPEADRRAALDELEG
ncbi:MAG TPA: N-6 DNA methylase [Vicinamibacterales bacterium]|nr:N-6 DNA methylase [Vicinamibacterales bacterium]